jgi:hypothetical protein
VLEHCAAPPSGVVYEKGSHPVPLERAWFATAARTRKTWLEPALRQLYRTINLDSWANGQCFVVSPDIVARIGDRVRTLNIDQYSNLPDDTSALAPFTHLTTLSLNLRLSVRDSPEDNRLIAVCSCPSFPNLTDLLVWYHPLSGFPLSTIFKACRNLRRLRCNLPVAHPLASDPLPSGVLVVVER